MAVGAGAVKAGAAFVSIFADSTALVKDLRVVENKIRQFGGSVQSIGASIGRVGVGVASLGAVGLSSLGWPLQLAANMETAEASFTTLLKDGNKAKALMAELQAFAAETPFQFDELADAGKKLLAFGSQAGNVQSELRRIGDISSAIGAPIGEIAEIYGKARVQGRLFAEDINQLTGRGIPVIQELAKQFGITDQEVKKLVESGKVNFGNLEKAFVSLTSGAGQFAGGMARQSKTLAGTFSTLKDTIIAAFRPFGEALLPAAKTALTIASNAVATFAKWAEQNKGLALPLAAASVALIGIGGAAVAAGGALVLVGSLITSIGSVVGVVGAAVATIGAPVALVVAGVVAGLASIGAGFAYVVAKAGLLGPVFGFLRESFGRLWAIASATIGGITSAMQSGRWGKAAEIAWAGVKLATLAGGQQVLKGIDSLWNNAGMITFKFFQTLNSLIFKSFSALPKIAWAAIRGGQSLNEAIASVIGTAFTGDKLDLAGRLQPSIEAARSKLMQLNQEQRAIAARGAAVVNAGGGQPGPRQPVPAGRRGVGSVGAAMVAGQAGQQPSRSPQPLQVRGPMNIDKLAMATTTPVAERFNRSAEQAASTAQGAVQGGSDVMMQILGVSQAQLFALRRLVAQGGLS